MKTVNKDVLILRLMKAAKVATNGWACYAKRDIEHRAIRELHREIDDITEALGKLAQRQEEK